METLKIIFLLITAHIFGDYVFQTQYIAETKGKNLYHLFVHCWIYTFLFALVLTYLGKADIFGILFILFSHFIIDFAKVKLSLKNPDKNNKYYIFDQVFHYIVIIILYFWIIF